ncbi:MAG: tRNA pseudouridine synthase A [Chlamydiae bacterium]|nr:tRNA pseudouridine synthase A [Chlamydiota bacterium]
MKEPSSTKYKLLISYDGTQYSGWQIQPNAKSIQALIQETLATILREDTPIAGSGRTDSGVHAHGQVAHFSTSVHFDLKKLLHSLNGILPPDIRILSLQETTPNFHARYSATSKVYRYHLEIAPVSSPFTRLYSYHLPYPIDLPKLKNSTKEFLGTHDFTSFSNEAHRGSASKNAIRTIHRLDLLEENGNIILEFEADGFLYKMVRNIVGTLLDVARGALSQEEISTILAAKDRRKAPTCAPPHGLFLVKVHYLPNVLGTASIEAK